DERAQSDHRLEQRRPARLRGGRRVGGAERDARAGPLDAHPPRRMPGSPRLPGTHEADRSGDPFEDVIAVVPGRGAAGQIGDAEAALDGFDVTVAEPVLTEFACERLGPVPPVVVVPAGPTDQGHRQFARGAFDLLVTRGFLIDYVPHFHCLHTAVVIGAAPQVFEAAESGETESDVCNADTPGP